MLIWHFWLKNVDASVCGKGVGAKVDDGLRRCGGFGRMMMCVGEEYSGGGGVFSSISSKYMICREEDEEKRRLWIR